MGFDIMHFNLHKTFSQPHGGGGPGAGSGGGARHRSSRTCRRRWSSRDGDRYRLDYDRPKSIGRVRGFGGQFGMFVRAYAYIRMWGPGLREMSETGGAQRQLPAGAAARRLRRCPYDRPACTSSCSRRAASSASTACTALDVAKRLMDHGFHPPTVYFPLVVPEALMIEPTETEALETLDAFCEAMLAIAARGGRGSAAAEGRAAHAGRSAGRTRRWPPSG